jgi:hypothetical protein
MKWFRRIKLQNWRSKERRGPLFNLALTSIYVAAGYVLLQIGLAEGRADPSAPFLFDSPDLQTLTASAFIGVALIFFFSGLRLAIFTSKLLADLKQGPATLVGYVTTREMESWRRSFRREQSNYRLYLVSRQAFPLWLQGSGPTEGSETFHWSYRSRRLPAVVPSIFLVPSWIYDMVREGDLIRLQYARWRRAVLDVEVLESVIPPLPSPHSRHKQPKIEADNIEWRLIEPEE